MQNIKYHLLNALSVVIFSCVLAATINQFFRLSISTGPGSQLKKHVPRQREVPAKTYDDYSGILNSGFFRKAGIDTAGGVSGVTSAISDLQLLGTISGPPAIARALIKKNTEKDAEIFRLWSTVYGFKLIRIDNSKVYLKSGGNVEMLDMFTPTLPGSGPAARQGPSTQQGRIQQTISRSELQQKVLNNMDNALQGLRAGPYRVDGKIEGYKLFRVQPSNILYKLGARNGDVVKRVNGHPIDSTEKLYKMWQSIQGESRITVDLDRGGKLINYEFSITE